MSDGTKLSRQSGAIAGRLKKIGGLSGMAKQAKTDFIAADKTFQTLTDATDVAEKARDKAIQATIAADVARDTTVLALADELVTAKLGKRANPFADYSQYTPANLVRIGHKAEGVAVRALCSAIQKKKPTGKVVKLMKLAIAQSGAVDRLLKAQDAPSQAYKKAFAARDAHLPAWQKARAELEVQMKAALSKQPGAYAALVAPPVDEAPAVPRPRKTKAPTQPVVTAPAPTNGASLPS